MPTAYLPSPTNSPNGFTMPSIAGSPSLAHHRRNNSLTSITTKPTRRSRGHKRRTSLAGAERNVGHVILSDMKVDAWYPSFYPEELVGKGADRLFVCKWCFRYTTELLPFIEHNNHFCELKESGPIGTLIYQQGCVSIYEVDGAEHKIFAQNLSLFAKLFLDTKSVFYDVTTFLYYTLCYTDPTSRTPNMPRVVGYFSKEKLSWDSNNLACICVFPPWQKRGFGQILMGISYELTRWDGRLGGPERPLSELGRRAYVRFWAATIARFIAKHPPRKSITVSDISQATFIMPDDIIATLKDMEIMERRKTGSEAATVNRADVLAWMAKARVDVLSPVDPNAFVNRPSVENFD